MSQYQIESAIDCQLILFGYDHALGYFYDIYDAQDEPTSGESSAFDGLTGVGLIERLWEHIDLDDPPEVVVVSGHEGATIEDLLCLAMADLPF